MDDRFGLGEFTPTGDAATVADALARALDLKAGTPIRVTVQKASNVPRSSPLAERDAESATKSIALTADHILPAGHPAGEFTLSPGPAPPLNLIVPLRLLQQEIGQPGRVNALLSPPQPLQPLQDELARRLTLDDWDLQVHVPPTRKAYISVESRRLILEPAAVEAATKAGAEFGQVAPTFVYLANSIAANGAEIPYSVVAGVDPAVDTWAFGPTSPPVTDDDIVLTDWPESPLKVKPGDAVTLTYFQPEVEGQVQETSHTFKLRALIPLDGPAADPDLVPPFPGITDKLSLRDWDPPFPYVNTRMKPADERYWQKYRTTPKAYITLAAARKLWGTRFGDTTSVRIIPQTGGATAALPGYRGSLLKNLDPTRGGFQFDPVAERLHDAGRGSTDFGMLFLAFSFFLIAAALMLVGLLFRLSLERRAREVGLLRAAGYPLKTVRRQLLLEGFIVSALGSAVGLLAALGYAAGMLYLLAKLWPTPGVGSFLTLHVSATSLVIGFVASVLMSELAVWWAVRGLNRIEPSHLLKGVSGDESATPAPSRWGPRIAIVGLLGAIALLVMAPYMPPGEPQAGTFFGGGALLLAAGLAAVWTWLKRPRRAVVRSLTPLGMRNATRNPTRSLLTAGLLASAAFLLVAVESFRREPDRDFLSKSGGSGGFPLLAETDSPVFQELTGEGTLTDVERPHPDRVPGGPQAGGGAGEEGRGGPPRVPGGDRLPVPRAGRGRRELLEPLPGDPAAGARRAGGAHRPRRVPVQRHAGQDPEEKANPWLLLRQSGDSVPAFVEENTAVWQLKKGLGDEIEVPDEEGRPVRMKIVGLLKDSVFQSEVVIGDAAFRKSFPRTEGFSYFLLDVAPGTDPKTRGTDLRAVARGLRHGGDADGRPRGVLSGRPEHLPDDVPTPRRLRAVARRGRAGGGAVAERLGAAVGAGPAAGRRLPARDAQPARVRGERPALAAGPGGRGAGGADRHCPARGRRRVGPVGPAGGHARGRSGRRPAGRRGGGRRVRPDADRPGAAARVKTGKPEFTTDPLAVTWIVGRGVRHPCSDSLHFSRLTPHFPTVLWPHLKPNPAGPPRSSPNRWTGSTRRGRTVTTDWLWHGLIARRNVTLFTSQWKAGKTTLVTGLLQQFATGGTFLDRPVVPAKVLVVSEESRSTWADRVKRMPLGGHCRLLARPFPRRPTPEQWERLVELAMELQAAGELDLLVIDPLARFLPGGTESDLNALNLMLDPLQCLTDGGAGVTILHHPRKKRAEEG